jgi:Dolichyl-phosphate-mannose-protein mannosyltransferase
MRWLFRNPAVILGAAVFAIAISRGSFVAGGSDSYGYLSQARLWAQGAPIAHEPLVARVTWQDADKTFAPLGYKPGVEPGTIVPVYSVGYPMLMGLVQRMFGHHAQMAIVPLMAAGLVVCTAAIGAAVGGPEVAILSSLLLATSPPFVYQSLQPMSDIPVAFWWTLAAVLAFRRSRAAHVAAGAAVAAAILTRPNLIPLAAPLALFGVLMNRRDGHGPNWRAGGAVVSGAVMGAVATAVVNTIFYGGAAVSGYGTPRELYALEHLSTNLARYFGWLIDTETPLVVMSLAGMLALARAGGARRWIAFHAAAVVSIVLCSYLFYMPFESWTYIRFLLPMYPLLFVSLLGIGAIEPLQNRPRVRTIVLLGLTLVIIASHLRYIHQWSLLSTKDFERRYFVVAQYARNALPHNAVFIALQHSGNIRYYADRTTLRYDWIPAQSLDDALAQLNALGFKPYFLLEDWEEPRFQSRFGAFSRLGKLDWPPTVTLRREGIRIWDPAER